MKRLHLGYTHLGKWICCITMSNIDRERAIAYAEHAGYEVRMYLNKEGTKFTLGNKYKILRKQDNERLTKHLKV